MKDKRPTSNIERPTSNEKKETEERGRKADDTPVKYATLFTVVPQLNGKNG